VKRTLIVLLGFFASVHVAYAAAYFEFNPDYAESLLAASSGTVEEVFLPLNEYLSGFDFWISNNNSGGELTITLFSPSGTQLAERTITVPPIADSQSGSRFHINLPVQLGVTGNQAYRVRFTTAVPTLRLYYANQNRIIPHNAPPTAAYTGGLARIDGEDMGYSFMFGLYENNEGSVPVLSNLSVSQPDIGHVLISFSANEPVDSEVMYGNQSVAYTGQYTSCLPGVGTCLISLAVEPGTEYSYTLHARDTWGNIATLTGTFTSIGQSPTPTPVPSSTVTPTPTPVPPTPTATPDTTAPIVTNPRAANITTNSTTIAWTTNEAANGIVTVFTLPFLTFAGAKDDSTMELEHALTVTGLAEDTYYRARVLTSDASGNTTQVDVDFLTIRSTPLPTGSTPTPTSSNTPTPTITVTESGDSSGDQEISWSPPASGEPTDGYRIDIFDQNGKLLRTVTTRDRSAVIPLEEGATVIVYANNDGLYEKVAAPLSSSTRRVSLLERLVILLPYILGGFVFVILISISIMRLRGSKTTPPSTVQTQPLPPGV
jgi:hypothetical protein